MGSNAENNLNDSILEIYHIRFGSGRSKVRNQVVTVGSVMEGRLGSHRLDTSLYQKHVCAVPGTFKGSKMFMIKVSHK